MQIHVYSQTVTDVEGNIYGTVIIGNQTWMSSSLRTTHFSNGDEIPTTIPATLNVNSESAPLYQWAYNGIDSLAEIYGRLYTWHVVADNRNVCPVGWHVPTRSEFDTLVFFLGGSEVAGGKLKQAGYLNWQYPNTGATNETGFNGVPNGNRNLLGYFNDMGIVSDVWSATEGVQGAWDFDLNYDNASTVSYDDPKGFAFAIRCLKNEPAVFEIGSVNVYPSLTDQFINISCSGYHLLKYVITSVNGEIVMSGDLLNAHSVIDLEGLSNGTYVIKIYSTSASTEFKFVKTK